MKNFNLLIDTKRGKYTTIEGIKQGDSNDFLNIQLINDNIPLNITGCTVRLNIRRPDGEAYYQDGNTGIIIANPSEGRIKIKLLSVALEKSGIAKADISIFDKDGKKITSATFEFNIVKEIYSEDALKNRDEWDVLENIGRNETERINNEKIRVSSENTRKANETERINSEDTRNSDENKRIVNELARNSDEGERISNEDIRKTNEIERKTNETTRVTKENERINNETTRISNEDIRKTNELNRQEGYWEMQDTFENFSVCEEYNINLQYKKFNRVTYNGSSYECIKDCTGIVPPNVGYWIMIAQKGLDGTGTGNMHTSVYDKNNNGIVDVAEVANSVEWSNVKNVPDLGAVKSVNGKTGIVVLKADDVGAYTKSEIDAQMNGKLNKEDIRLKRLVLINNWGGYLAYFVDTFGIAHVFTRESLYGGTSNRNTVIANIPTTFRPATTFRAPVFYGDGANAYYTKGCGSVRVSTDGDIVLDSDVGQDFHLNFSFPTKVIY